MKKTVLKIVFIIVAVLLVIDEYTKNGSKIEVYYSLGDKNKITAPDGEYEAYDMYGNAGEKQYNTCIMKKKDRFSHAVQ